MKVLIRMSLLGTALHFLESLLLGAVAGGIGEVGAFPFQVGRRLSSVMRRTCLVAPFSRLRSLRASIRAWCRLVPEPRRSSLSRPVPPP